MEFFLQNPGEIEKRSFEIITRELGNMKFKTSIHEHIVKRVIHTTADFSFAEILEISGEAVEKGVDSLKKGAGIVTDTNMAKAGINKRLVKKLGGSVACYVAHEDVAETARRKGITRSMAAIEKAIQEPNNKIFVIGNAPTALFWLKKQIEENKVKPDLIIGVPVGFVGAAESKEAIKHTGIPYIITRGRKGGSNVAAAIVNALLYCIDP